MAERTIKDIHKDIAAVEEEIAGYKFIAGDKWHPAVVTYEEDEGFPLDFIEDYYEEYIRGERIGETHVVIHSDGPARLTPTDLVKINLNKTFVDGLLYVLADLRKEKHEFRQAIRNDSLDQQNEETK